MEINHVRVEIVRRIRIISVSSAGEVTGHWQLTDMAVARRMAKFVSARTKDEVKIRSVLEIVQTFEIAVEVPI